MPQNRQAYMLRGMELGDRITERLLALGISQAELARRVKVSQPTINALIRGGATGSKHLHRIAAELETSPAYLAGETDDPAPIAPRTSAIEALADELDLGADGRERQNGLARATGLRCLRQARPDLNILEFTVAYGWRSGKRLAMFGREGASFE